MLLFSQNVFDELVVGTAHYFTASTLEGLLATADFLVVIAHVTEVAGGSPRLVVYLEQSCNGRDWYAPSTALIDAAIANDTVVAGMSGNESLGFARLRVALQGSSPQARIRIGGCGRSV